MRWEDERYVRLYTRDTLDWLSLSFEAQGLLALLLRKVDRAGLLELGKHGKRGVAAAVGHAHRWPAIEPALDELLTDGCIEIRDSVLVFRNFIEAQEAQASDKARKQAQRERDRDKARAAGSGHLSDAAMDEIARANRLIESDNSIEESHAGEVTPVVTQAVTQDGHSGKVTQDGHAGKVTPSLAEPSCAEPNQINLSASADLFGDSGAPLSKQVREVFGYWQQVLNHPRAKLDSTREGVIQARLKAGRTVAELCKAIDGCKITPHNQGHNERNQVYDDIELICRNDVNVERFIRNADRNPIAPRKNGSVAAEAYAKAEFEPDEVPAK